MNPKAFKTQAAFADWLAKNHGTKIELWMRLYKVHARTKGIGYREALDESLCWGWIDGVRYSLNDDSFRQRFTPRQQKSIWSAVNLKRIKELIAEKKVMPPGLEALKRWGGKKAPSPSRIGPRNSRPTSSGASKPTSPRGSSSPNRRPGISA